MNRKVKFIILLTACFIIKSCNNRANTSNKLQEEVIVEDKLESRGAIQWEALYVNGTDTLIYKECNFSNMQVKENVDSGYIWVQYIMDDATFKIKEVIGEGTSNITYISDQDFIITCQLLSDDLAIWEVPQDNRTLYTSKPNRYRYEREPAIYCWGLDELYYDYENGEIESIIKETTIDDLDIFLKVKYNERYFDTKQILKGDINSDGLEDIVMILSRKNEGKESILLALLKVQDKKYQVVIENSNVLTSLTTKVELENGKIIYEETDESSGERSRHSYVYNKQEDDLITEQEKHREN